MTTQTAIFRERPKVRTNRQHSARIVIPSHSTQRVTPSQRNMVVEKPRKSGKLLRFLFLTSIIFGFGGLGFGLGVRFAEHLPIFSNSPDPVISNN